MRSTRVAALVCLAVVCGIGQTREADAPPKWSWLERLRVSGLADGYYSINFNHPASRANQLRNFDIEVQQFSLNMVKLTVEKTPEPLGWRAELGVGRAFELIHASGRAPTAFRNIPQAYLAFKPAWAGGLQVDAGKFVTWAGAEVIETDGNWNYSRSLLFALAIPYYHFGIRAVLPLTGGLTAGVQAVNGWNHINDNNSGKTLGLTGGLSRGKFTWNHVYYFGPETAETNRGLRHLYDTVLLVKPAAKLDAYVNFDYGSDRASTGERRTWIGLASAARYALMRRFALSPRIEWFNDIAGFCTGTPQRLKEATLTGELKLHEGLLTRLEYRQDWSDRPFFDRGAVLGASRRQRTLLLGVIVSFGREP